MCLNFSPLTFLPTYKYELQNVSEKKVLNILHDKADGSWVFRFDYITQKYYLTIKNKNDEYINHEVCYYCKRTDEVFIQMNNKLVNSYSSLESYLQDMKKIYFFDLSKQVYV
jgi:hypothetical protein